MEYFRHLIPNLMDLQAHPFFKQADEARLAAIKDSTHIEKIAPGSIIFEEGDESDALYLVLDGCVVFKKHLNNGELLTISTSRSGEYFGEIGVLTNEPRSLRAETDTEAILGRIPGEVLIEFLQNMPGRMENLLQSVIHHLHDTTRQYIDDRLRQEKMALVGNMTNTIIHDFKNPFCLISLSAQLLRQRHSEEKSQRLCHNIEKQVDRMVAMAGELAEFSRGEQQIQKSALDLREFFEEFKSLNYPFFEDDNISVELDIPEATLMASKPKLFRVFQNLISNAIDAFGENSGSIKIFGHRSDDGNFVHLYIQDDAGGIPDEIRSRFFEPFVTYGKREGTGLGTAIAKSIIEAHGGRITFVSETGNGTTFNICLPLASSADSDT